MVDKKKTIEELENEYKRLLHAMQSGVAFLKDKGDQSPKHLRVGINSAMVNDAALVYSFLVKYFGTAIGQFVDDPLHAVTSKDRFGVVTVKVDSELYMIVDIGMRMLLPRELARAQGFPDSYVLTGSKTCQVASIGNSVSPVVAEAVVRANMRVTA